MVNLSKKQEEIVYAPMSPILVKASAGSGKTRVLTERIRFLLKESKRNVLAITFSNKAAEEMRERLADEPNIQERTFIGTFHAFCTYVLENHGSSIGFSPMPHIFEHEDDRLVLLEEVVKETPSLLQLVQQKDLKSRRQWYRQALDIISQIKRELLSPEELFEQEADENLVLLYKSYQEVLISQNGIDFDDLLYYTYRLFIDRPAIAKFYNKMFENICVDEAQDLNNAQYQLLKSLLVNDTKNLFMVGDANQSIYAFAGANPSYMIEEFPKDFNAKIFELKENFRSSKAVLEGAEKIIPNTTEVSNSVVDGEFMLTAFKDEDEEALWVCDKIKEFIHLKQHKDIEGDISYDDIAILARNKYILKTVEEKLREYSIPYYYKTSLGAIQLESNVMNIFYLGLQIKINPKDVLHKQNLIKHTKIEIPANVLGVNALQYVIDNTSSKAIKEVLAIVIILKENCENLKSKLTSLKKDTSLFDTENERESFYNDVDELLIHWHKYASNTKKHSLVQFRRSLALGNTNTVSKHTGVALSTVHTLKGQEYNIVFLIGLNNGVFPDYRATTDKELEQERNNLYVAFTRSKRLLYTSWTQKRMMPWGDYKRQQISSLLQAF